MNDNEIPPSVAEQIEVNEMPVSIAKQIEVLEAAKGVMVSSFIGTSCTGLCYAINCVICKSYNHLSELAAVYGIRKVIPSFNFPHAVLSGTVSDDAVPYWYWWPTEVEEGGITNRLNFLDYLIDKLKNEDHEE